MFRNHKVAVLLAEFIGTFILASAVLAMVLNAPFSFFPALVAGLVLMVMVFVIGPISGAHINPAVTVGLWTQKKVETTQAIAYIITQLAAGFAAWKLGEWLLDMKLPDISGVNVDARIMVAEVIGAAIFGMGIIAAVNRGYEGARQAVAIGFSLTLGILVASLGSNGILNPAVAIGLNSGSLSYFLAPVIGMVAGMALYSAVLSHAEVLITKKR